MIIQEFGEVQFFNEANDPFTIEVPLKNQMSSDITDHIDSTFECVEIWTDGSLTRDSSPNENHKMGAAATFWCYDQKQDSIKIKIDPYNASSTKAELIAILKALMKCHPHQKIKIYTDSQASIDSIINFSKTTCTRKLMKFTNYDILYDIKHIFNAFVQTPVFIKVQGHSGLIKNDEVDYLAKEASNLDSMPFKNPNFTNKPFLYNASKIINVYPNKFIKMHNQNYYRDLTNMQRQQILFEYDPSVKLLHLGMNKLRGSCLGYVITFAFLKLL